MNVLVACEYSGRVRDAFTRRGHFAMSCDLLPSETPGFHWQGDVTEILDLGWDLMICHPPCTHLAVSGARYFKEKRESGVQQEALAFVKTLMDAPIPRIALENPVSIISSAIRKPDQIIQPWQFGHGESKQTCLWLKGLPPLVPTAVLPTGLRDTYSYILKMAPGPERWKQRSRTFEGIAEAMAEQWSNL